MKFFLLAWIASTIVCSSIQAQAIVIHEIFADPTPSRGLPELEFIELYNRTSHRVDLTGYTLLYGSTKSVFPVSFIEPNEYLIVCRSTHTKTLEAFGRTVGLTNLTLRNSGQVLVLRDAEDRELHRVAYSATWYAPERSEGYSLEMIDAQYPCQGQVNWTSSLSLTGATPGQANASARPNSDTASPELLAYRIAHQEVMLFFNEVLHPHFAENPYHYSLPDLSVQTSAFADDSRQVVLLRLDRPLAETTTLTVLAPRDCSGNEGSDLFVALEVLPPPRSGELCLSEILFHAPPGGVEYAEIHNTTNKRFNVQDWLLARTNAAGEITGHARLSDHALVIPAYGWLVFTRDSLLLRSQYPSANNVIEVKSLPTFPNELGTVVLLRPDSSVYESFTYTSQMHAQLIHSAQGVALERVNCQDTQWKSASADAGFATPGAPNSQLATSFSTPVFAISPPVFDPKGQVAQTWLQYWCSEAENYASIGILDRHGRLVRSLTRNHLLGTTGQIAWDGKDDRGVILPPGNYAFSITLSNASTQRKMYAKVTIGFH